MADTEPPVVGMIVRGRYLWHEQAAAERDHAPYSRPCLVVRVNARDGRSVVDVLPLSSKPQDDGRGFELPPDIARRFGLGSPESYVVTQEKNVVAWSPRFTETIPGRDTPVYGHLTPGLTRKAVGERLAQEEDGTALTVERQQDDQKPSRDLERVRGLQRGAKARAAAGKPHDGPEHEH